MMAVRELVPSLSWPVLERRYLVGAVLAAGAAILVLVLTAPAERVPILVAGEDLPAGTPLSELSVEVRYVESAEGLVTGSSVGDLGDWTLAIPINAGEPITASNVRAPELLDSTSLMSIAVPEEHAVLGRLAPGDIVDIHHTSDGIGSEPVTTLLAQSVYVIDAVPPGDSVSGSDVMVLLAVDDQLASVLASSIHHGSLDLVRVGP